MPRKNVGLHPVHKENSIEAETAAGSENSAEEETVVEGEKPRKIRKIDSTRILLLLCALLFAFLILQIEIRNIGARKTELYFDLINETESATQEETETEPAIVDINTAGTEELCRLNGIGESKAQAIIDYRTENGPFASIEDIKNVSGIGESVFEKIKDNITVSQ